MSLADTFSPIPQPPTIPFLGNVHLIDNELPLSTFLLLQKQYGPIYKLNFLGREVVVVGNHNLINQASDEARFRKNVNSVLQQVRNGVGDGLFTAFLDEPNWGIARKTLSVLPLTKLTRRPDRVLMPAFGPTSIRGMWDDMVDICDQLTVKWARFGSEHIIEPSDDFTRLAFDTVCLCAMDYRLNSFYSKELPGFIEAMGNFLKESGTRTRRPKIVQSLMMQTNSQYYQDIKTMNDVAEKSRFFVVCRVGAYPQRLHQSSLIAKPILSQRMIF
jgi:cytochrome P450/NADPH-cytochrome P450 reductase